MTYKRWIISGDNAVSVDRTRKHTTENLYEIMKSYYSEASVGFGWLNISEETRTRKNGNGDAWRKRKEKFLPVGFLQIIPERLDCSCLCRWEHYARSRDVSQRIMHRNCLCHMVSIGLPFISILMPFKL